MITSFRSIRRLRERCVDAMTATSDEKGGENGMGRVVLVPRVRADANARMRRAIGRGLNRGGV